MMSPNGVECDLSSVCTQRRCLCNYHTAAHIHPRRLVSVVLVVLYSSPTPSVLCSRKHSEGQLTEMHYTRHPHETSGKDSSATLPSTIK